jgi:ribonuclease T
MCVDIPQDVVERFAPKSLVAKRFRGFLPVVVDVETGGFNPETDALLEIAAVTLTVDENSHWIRAETIHRHVQPFPGANIEKAALEFTGIDPHHPFRNAVSEREALDAVFKAVRRLIVEHGCSRAILVGHNAFFDLSFLKSAAARAGIKRNPFHSFSTFDTAALAALVYGQTVLARAVEAAGLEWKAKEAHSALYDAEVTADLFCAIVNVWDERAAANANSSQGCAGSGPDRR